MLKSKKIFLGVSLIILFIYCGCDATDFSTQNNNQNFENSIDENAKILSDKDIKSLLEKDELTPEEIDALNATYSLKTATLFMYVDAWAELEDEILIDEYKLRCIYKACRRLDWVDSTISAYQYRAGRYRRVASRFGSRRNPLPGRLCCDAEIRRIYVLPRTRLYAYGMVTGYLNGNEKSVYPSRWFIK